MRNFPIILAAFLIALSLFPSHVRAAIECYECHGTKNPVDYRPLDAPYRNVTTGGFRGNHRSHLSETNSYTQCERCHQGSSAYNQGHRDGKIQLSANINNSLLRALYNNRTSATPQTSTPIAGSCTNVNCHFETLTPLWGSPLFNPPSDCGQCHGSPPNGSGTSGSAGSHIRHDQYFTGATQCIKCHPGHAGFSHATSAGRPLAVTLRDPANIPGGSYSGPVDDYLPSQTNLFGSCANLYCHSDGTSVSGSSIPPNTTPEWGAGTLACSACHGLPPAYSSGTPKANSHSRHATKGILCSRCHYGTTTDNLTISSTRRHVNKFYNISAQGERLTYAFNTNGGTCSNGYCHSNGTSLSSGNIPANTSASWGSPALSCTSCHGYPPGYANNAPKKNSHPKHNNYSYACSRCHSATTIDGITISNQANHVNEQYDVAPGVPAFFVFSSSRTGGSCTSNSCHNDGTSVATGLLVTRPAKWGTPIGCTGCHDSRPDYTSGSPKANSHMYQPHKLNCSSCHYGTTTNGTTITNASTHLNGTYDLQPNTLTHFTYTYAPTGGTCINTGCHATASGSRTWGGQPDDCNACHESPPNTPSHRRHFSGTSAQARYTSLSIASPGDTDYLFNCANCHPRDINRHRDGFVDVELYDPTAPAGSIKALNPPEAAYILGATTLYDSRNYPYSEGTCSNVYCHSTTRWTTPMNCIPQTYSSCDQTMFANVVATKVYKDVTWGSSLPTNCTGCHENPVTSSSSDNFGMTGNSHRWLDAAGQNEIGHVNKYWFRIEPISCSYCHNDTVKELNKWGRHPGVFTVMSGVPIASKSKHVNGIYDVAFDKSSTYSIYYPGLNGNGKTTFYQFSTASYEPTSKTCSNVSCHLGQPSVKWGYPYRPQVSWYRADPTPCKKCHNGQYTIPFY